MTPARDRAAKGAYSGHGLAVLRLGVVADPHLAPSGTGPRSYHNEYRMEDAGTRFRLAMARCAREGVDAVALPGDLSHFGDGGSLSEGVRIAGESGLPVLAVAGNHDVVGRAGALAEAVVGSGAANVRLARPGGELVGGVRLAGFSVTQGTSRFSGRSLGDFDVEGWGEGPAVVVTHYPVVSLAEKVAAEGLKYPGDLEDLPSVAGPLLRRTAPTVVVHGHAHVRDALVSGGVLQISCAALVEPPFEATFLDVTEEDVRVSVRSERVPIAPSPDGARLPVLSPQKQGWVFEEGAWKIDGPD